MNLEFLSVDDVLEIHDEQLARFGGGEGVRDEGLLESAIAQPMATFDGAFVHRDLFEMAGAYLFHIVANHPFVDGNKRTGLLAALVFLALNGVEIAHSSEALYDLTMAVAEGSAGKQDVASCLRRLGAS